MEWSLHSHPSAREFRSQVVKTFWFFGNNKFDGLSDMFEAGCDVMPIDGVDFQSAFTSSMDMFWKSAQQMHVWLIENAAKQVELGRLAYQKLFSLVDSQINEN